ncbi:MAG TPA: HK97 gp10 family phage protein [Candidatus Atribacteria bacterium]|nr:MAG: HK97 gp10 family phage protein [Candidatus Nealsonbacteria bacterium]HDK26588.1 HK97 gp10 family phage protein [Candidatus Atribacteria bacterium]
METKVYIDPKQIEKIFKLPLKSCLLAFQYVATEVWAGLREEPPIDHGRLRGSWQMQKIKDIQYKMSSGVEYAPWVAYGTGIYGPKGQPIHIEPKVAQCLHFVWNGMEIFAKSVEVQGQKANPFHERALKRGESRIDEFIRRALRETGE